eukprot:Skav230737  [mRNA]  locus=scaffold3436:4580:4750:+ [translate_table: standard]
MSRNWNDCDFGLFMNVNWRASLVPVAAAISLPIAYRRVVAIGQLVVEFLLAGVGGE